MSITLAEMVTELQGRVAARNSIPSAAQYARAIKDAAADFSRRCSREKLAQLNIVSGTANYDLPADFVRMIGIYDPATIEGVWVTPGGLVPTNVTGLINERYTYAGGQLTITPTPAYSMARTISYAAGWALTGATGFEAYADMTYAESAIVLIKAEAECLTLQINSEGSGVLSYRIGDESFDKSGGVQAMTGQRNARRAEYMEACESYNGSITLYGGLCQS